MNPEPWNWIRNDLEMLIGQFESLRMDFKQSSLLDQEPNMIAQNLSKQVSAFANTEGGVIVIGIAERKEGRTRFADQLDQGVEINKWSPERIQQLVESNISPYLTGIRVRPIPLDESRKKYAYVIYVPAGTTAYQASDRRYYGRSEYECRPLPDHEIRLRMFRGQAPNATIRTVDWEVRRDRIYVDLVCDLFFENIGELNITEFKLQLRCSSCSEIGCAFERPTSYLYLPSKFPLDFKDGWPDPRIEASLDERLESMKVNVYPGDSFYVGALGVAFLPDKIGHHSESLTVDWTLHLKNTSPIKGQINLTPIFELNQQVQGKDEAHKKRAETPPLPEIRKF